MSRDIHVSDLLKAHTVAHDALAEPVAKSRRRGPRHRPGAFPHAELACRELLALPIHPTLSPTAQSYVVDQIAAFYQLGSGAPASC